MNKREKKVLSLWQQLSDSDQDSVQEFSEFLLQRNGGKVIEDIPSEPLNIERPVEESVIAAIKRLSATFPMINKDNMLNETSSLVSQHIVQGRDAVEVIDELEIIFHRHYELIPQQEE